MTPIYLDHNASTPTEPSVIEATMRAMVELWANPSSSEHSAGSAAAAAVEKARESIATTINCRAKEVVFCSGSTEANNLALFGSIAALKSRGKHHVVTTAIEHPSILACLDQLKTDGAEVTIVPVGATGRVKTADVMAAIRPDTGLVSVMAANNETGVCQPIEAIGALCTESGVLFHTDYSQATAYRTLDVEKANVNLASFSGHKMYGPKGVGALYASLRKPRVRLEPVLHGGGQERGLRSGTLNTPAIVGLGRAFDEVRRRRAADAQSLTKLRSRFIQGITAIPGAKLNGDQRDTLPNTVSISIEGIEPLALMHTLKKELTFSASSACSTDKVESSHVLRAMYGEGPRTKEAFRIGMGRSTTEAQIDFAIAAFVSGVDRLRTGRLGSLSIERIPDATIVN